MDAMEWPWQYECRSIELSNGSTYTPDFCISHRIVGPIFAEVKPVEPAGFEILKMRSAQPILLLVGPPAFRDYWFLQHGEESLRLIETWVAAPMDLVVDSSDFSIRYHQAVEKALVHRFDGYDQDRQTIKERYQ